MNCQQTAHAGWPLLSRTGRHACADVTVSSFWGISNSILADKLLHFLPSASILPFSIFQLISALKSAGLTNSSEATPDLPPARSCARRSSATSCARSDHQPNQATPHFPFFGVSRGFWARICAPRLHSTQRAPTPTWDRQRYQAVETDSSKFLHSLFTCACVYRVWEVLSWPSMKSRWT